jgi:hypothetical protein
MFGTFAAGGADSYGYLSQARLLAAGRLTADLAPSAPFTWPDVPATLTPLGYTAGAAPGTLAPLYPPGLPLLMAPLALVHPDAVFAVVALSAAAAVGLCWPLGRAVGEPLAGALAAVLLALSPTFLYQAVQPMSDVPVTAAWMAALLMAGRKGAGGATAAGVLTSIAILIRPNLAPLAALVVFTAGGSSGGITRAIVCVAGMLPGIVALGVIQHARYGSALASGYGSIGDLFAMANVGPNLERYPRWMIETHTAAAWAWLAAPLWILRARAAARRFAWISYAFSLAVVAAYLPYIYFRPEEWTYTRFLLPALPFMLVLGIALALDLLRRAIGKGTAPIVIAMTAGLAIWLAAADARLGVLRVFDGERKYVEVGGFVASHLPPSAVIFAKQHSGSIRYYSGRQTVRWDVLDPAWLDRAVTELRAAGHVPFVVLDSGEPAEFRQRFERAGQRTVSALEPLAVIRRTELYAIPVQGP